MSGISFSRPPVVVKIASGGHASSSVLPNAMPRIRPNASPAFKRTGTAVIKPVGLLRDKTSPASDVNVTAHRGVRARPARFPALLPPVYNRSTDKQQKPGWPFWTSIAVLLPVLYVASFGPACWWDSRSSSGPVIGLRSMMRMAHWSIGSFYRPLITIACRNAPTNTALSWYVSLGARRGTQVKMSWISSHPGARTPELFWDVPVSAAAPPRALPVKPPGAVPDGTPERG